MSRLDEMPGLAPFAEVEGPGTPMLSPEACTLLDPTADPAGPSTPHRDVSERTRATRPRSQQKSLLFALEWESLVPRSAYARWGKRLLTASILLVALPIAAVIAIPIAIANWIIFGDYRRILFSQPRVGFRGEEFSIYKFRTMREPSSDDFASWMNGQDGLRVTRFGRFLRNTHLDELPQLINVFRGEMDFIGPRPEMVEIDRWACSRIPKFRRRNAVLPGITGYAQVTHGYAGRDVLAYARKLAADNHYIQHLSLRLDLLILLRTVGWMLRGRGWRWQIPSSNQAQAAPQADPQVSTRS